MAAPLVSQTYVQGLLKEMQDRNRTLHKKIAEVEAIRHLEDKIALPAEEQPSGLVVRVGAAAQLIEDVKAALTSNMPVVRLKPLLDGDPAKENSSKRELFWRHWVGTLLKVFNELADGQVGLGVITLKAIYYPWPKGPRKRLPSEKGDDKAYKERVKALKRLWGPPFRLLTVHPLTFYPRFGEGERIAESIEHSWKPRRDIYGAYGLSKLSDLDSMPRIPYGDLPDTQAGAVSGLPTEEIRGLPDGSDTSTMCQVTEYWQRPSEYSAGVYVVYVDGRQVHQEQDPGVNYELCIGRTSSSKDPDKLGTSVAEIMRHNEPTLNRTLTRVAEATELLVRKRLTLEVQEGTIIPDVVPETVGDEQVDNRPQPKTFKFRPDVAEALPQGAKVIDPFAGVENAYQALPFVELMFRIIGSHGVSPIFRGIPPGAAGSGYRDNSLYMMALSQFKYLQDSYESCIGNQIVWCEGQIQRRGLPEVWSGDFSLKPSDIRDFPAEVVVSVTPLLPQSLISEGQFYDRMWSQGHVTRRVVLEKGLREEQPEQILGDRMFEDVTEMLKPLLYQDVLQTVGVMPPSQPGLVGPNGQPLRAQAQRGGGGGAQGMLASMRRDGQGEAGQAMGGYTRAGQERQPPQEAGSV
jgi:hypothetical protein